MGFRPDKIPILVFLGSLKPDKIPMGVLSRIADRGSEVRSRRIADRGSQIADRGFRIADPEST